MKHSMGKDTVFYVTIYMSIGAGLNLAATLYLISHAHDIVEAFMTIIVINVAIIMVLRDVARGHEVRGRCMIKTRARDVDPDKTVFLDMRKQ